MVTFTSQIDGLESVISSAELRHRVLSHNLSNVNTPGYQRQDVSFEEHVRAELQGETARTPEIVETGEPAARPDGNNVDIDREVGALTENAMTSQLASQLLGRFLSMFSRAVR